MLGASAPIFILFGGKEVMYVLECTINGDKSYIKSNGLGLAVLVSDIKEASFFKDLKDANEQIFLIKDNELFNLKPVEIKQEKPNFGYSVKIPNLDEGIIQ